MYHTLNQLLQPFPLLMAALGLSLLVRWMQRPEQRPWLPSLERRGWLKWVSALYLLLLIDALPVTAWWTTHWLESKFPRVNQRPDNTRVIVVLTGGLIPGTPPTLDEGSLRRALLAAQLYREGPPCPVIVTGGRVGVEAHLSALADVMGDFLVQCGVPAEDVVREVQSQNTADNAQFTAAILRERNLTEGVVLVSSATHLWRAEQLFRAQGIAVTPVGCGYRSDEIGSGFWLFWPKASAIRFNQEVLHEVLGVAKAWYAGQLQPRTAENPTPAVTNKP